MSDLPPPTPVRHGNSGTVTYLYEPSQEERTFGTLAHALQMAGTWIAPLVIFLIKKQQSRFVAFHSLQALLLQVVLMIVWFGGMAVMMIAVLASTLQAQSAGTQHQQPPTMLFALFLIFWLVAMLAMVFALIATVLYSIKAGRGEWAKYPILGSWAARMLHIDFSLRYPSSLSPDPPQLAPPQ